MKLTEKAVSEKLESETRGEALWGIKNNKAVGPDEIPVEVLKCLGEL